MEEFKNCTVKIASVFTVHETIDDRGRIGNKVGSFFEKKDANSAAVGKGWYGGSGSVSEEKIIIITESNGKQMAFAIKSENPIDISDTKTPEQYQKVNDAISKIQKMGLSKDEIRLLASSLS